MSYAQIHDLEARLGVIYEPVYSTSAESAPSDDLESAAAEIDGALANRYKLPVKGGRSLALLKDWNLTLAEERAYARCAGSEYAEKVKLCIDQVRKYLDMILANQFQLPDAEEKNSSEPGSGIALFQAEKPVFGRDIMKGF